MIKNLPPALSGSDTSTASAGAVYVALFVEGDRDLVWLGEGDLPKIGEGDLEKLVAGPAGPGCDSTEDKVPVASSSSSIFIGVKHGLVR